MFALKSNKNFILIVRKNFHFINIQAQVTPLSQLKSIPNEKEGEEFRIFLKNQNETLSFWHDVNLKNVDNTYRMIVEIPRKEKRKMEMAKEEVDNPLKQDYKISNGNKILRSYGIEPIFNYGFLPQTWENPHMKLVDDLYGDDDPLDIIEIGSRDLKMGEILDVYILGSFCLLDQNEIDWKIIAINREDAERDFLRYFEKCYDDFAFKYVNDIMRWFRIYKTYEGKKENIIHFNNKLFNVKETEKIIFDSHLDYVKLKDRKYSNLKIDYNKYNFDL
jgi:inorganic pyrophosphatase